MAAEDGITQAVVDFHAADAGIGDIFLHRLNSVGYFHAVQEAGVHHLAFLGIETCFGNIRTLNQRNNRQIEMLGKRVVAAVVCRNRHDCACSVACEYIIGDINRYLSVRERIDSIGTGKHTRYFAVGNAFAFRTVFATVEVCLHFGALLVRHHALHIFAFRRKNHERHTEDGIRTGRKDSKRFILTLYGKLHLCTFAATDPVALGLFEALCPVQTVQSFKQSCGISTHAQAPLPHNALLHGITAANTQSFADFIIGKDGSQRRAPVHFCIAQIRNTVVHQPLLLLFFTQGLPSRVFGFPFGDKFADGTCFLQRRIVIGVEHLQERPLRPFVELRIAGAHLTAPVIAETDFAQLLDVSFDILVGRHLRVLTGLDGILFRRQTVGVKTHRVQNIEALLTFVAAVDIAGDVA